MGTDQGTVGVLAKRAQPGQVKTRLAMEVGEDVAAKLYGAWLAGFFDRLNSSDLEWVLFVDPPGSEERFRDQYDLGEVEIVDQPQGDLGNRMLFAQQWIAENRSSRSLLLGSDSPDLPLDWVRTAGGMLANNDLVIGPARDGGYYLLGSNSPTPGLLTGMQWSRRNVLRRTLHRAELTERMVLLLPEWRDVDTLADWRAFLARASRYWEPYFDLDAETGSFPEAGPNHGRLG